ncbi:hypothetical protein [Nocardia callitridis]|uniref:WXG100 family type VII secretion target n=1 Tax=Nocardia callitridis TaxID=648753 RepID=A0ABP9L2Y2_9NOCA
MAEQVKVDPAVLKQAADGIEATIGELSTLGISETGNMGRGFSLLTMSTLEVGKHTVQKSFEEFTERWSWGVRDLVQSGNTIAQVLGLAAGRYDEMENLAEGTFKQMWTHLAGNPHLSEDEITKRSWGDTFSDNAFNHIRNADYSQESFEKAGQKMQTNLEVVKEVGPQALANVSPLGGLAMGETPGYDTGAAERAAEIMKERGGQ